MATHSEHVDTHGEQPPPKLRTRDWVHGIVFVVLGAIVTIAIVIWLVLAIVNTPCCTQGG